MEPDILISVRFLTPDEGGRAKPVAGHTYACPLCVDWQGFDCRLILDGRCLEPGIHHEVPVKFLYRNDALAQVRPGTAIRLWDQQYIAHGEVIQVFDRPPIEHPTIRML